MRHCQLAVNTALLGLLAAPGAVAQQAETPAAEPDATPATLKPVTVTGRRPSADFNQPTTSTQRLGGDVRDIPQSVVVINKALMQSQGATSLTSALRNVPGLTVGAAEGGQIGNNINLNGFSARTDMFLDGARDRGQYYRDTFALDSVEVLMGPSSMLFGRGSTGGVINQVLKKPSLKQATELQIAATTNGLVRTTADHNQPLSETSAARISIMFQEGKASTRNQTELLDFGVAPSLKFGIGTPTEITLSALLQHNRDKPDYGMPPLNGFPANAPRNVAYGYDNDNTAQDVISLGVNVNHKFFRDTSLRNQTQINYVVTNARETAPQSVGTVLNGVFTPLTTTTGLPLSSLYVRQQSHDRDIFDMSLFNQTELSTKFDTGPFKHALLTGIEVGFDSYYNQNFFRNGTCNGVALQGANALTGYTGCSPLLSPNNSDPGAPSRAGNLATANSKSIAGYVNDSIDLLPELKLVGGLRYDVFAAQIGNTINTLNTPGNTTLAFADQTTTFTSVRGGVIFQPETWQAYYVSYSTSFNPSLEQLVTTTGTSQPLPPEQNEAFEIGSKIDLLAGNLSLTGALFQITKLNSRSQNADGTFTANGTVRVQGARAGISGRLTDQWQIFAGYTYLDARIVSAIAAGTANMMPLNTPNHSATLWTSYNFTEQWEAGGGVTFMGRRYANNTNTVQAPEFFRFDAMAAYHFETFDVRLNVFNLFDSVYYDQLIASDGGRSVPGSGRAAMLSLAKRF